VKLSLLELLRCPVSGQRLRLATAQAPDDEVAEGWLLSSDGCHRYPIRRSIPRFVPESNYADSFGMQWNRFSRTQLDSHSGHPISARRFWTATGWSAREMAGKWVLDVGCGAGRFAEVALQAGAKVVALDYSTAVDACHGNLAHHPDLHVIQGDIYSLPLASGRFAFVYSLGVLQHTPDVGRAFAALPPMVQSGGRLCVDFYEKSWKSRLLPKYWLRPLTRHVPRARLFAAVERLVPALLPLSRALSQVPGIGRQLKRLVPVANHFGELPLDPQQQMEWALLDTFDWLSPQFDQPQTSVTVREWLERAGLVDVEVLKAGHLVGRGRVPPRSQQD
jgi:2-polyprenyl-3-methyl-5-hydroxy-6-metoxy-1,4-benzoquinol methylase